MGFTPHILGGVLNFRVSGAIFLNFPRSVKIFRGKFWRYHLQFSGGWVLMPSGKFYFITENLIVCLKSCNLNGFQADLRLAEVFKRHQKDASYKPH